MDGRGTVTAVLGGDCVITCVPADGIGRGAQCGIHVQPFSIAEKEWTVDRMTGVTIPVQWHCFDPIALELKTNSAFFRATWDAQDNILIQPLPPCDRLRVRIGVDRRHGERGDGSRELSAHDL